jgi:hypothetical protein
VSPTAPTSPVVIPNCSWIRLGLMRCASIRRSREPYSLLGFGGGHRPCIGKRFALLEMRLFVATLLLRFEVKFGPQKSDADVL